MGLKSSKEAMALGSNLLPKMKAFGSQKEDEQESTTSARKEFEEELQTIESYLASASHDGPFLEGSAPTAADCALIPKLYHAVSVLGHFCDFQISESMPQLRQYTEHAFKSGLFEATSYPPELVIAGWAPKLGRA